MSNNFTEIKNYFIDVQQRSAPDNSESSNAVAESFFADLRNLHHELSASDSFSVKSVSTVIGFY